MLGWGVGMCTMLSEHRRRMYLNSAVFSGKQEPYRGEHAQVLVSDDNLHSGLWRHCADTIQATVCMLLSRCGGVVRFPARREHRACHRAGQLPQDVGPV